MVFFAAVQLNLLLASVGKALQHNATIAGKSLVTRAVSPDFQAYSQDTQQRQALRDQMVQGFKNALVLASVTALTFNPCDETFLRYFEEDDGDFVRGVFDEIANFPPDPLALPGGLRAIITGAYGINPKYAQVSISAGDHQELNANERDCANVNPGVTYAAHTNQFGDELGDRGLISLCPIAFRFPTIAQITNGNPGCQGLGPYDSGWMTPLGGHILHELVHWRYLIYDGPLFDQIVVEQEGVPDGENIISDYDADSSNEFEPPDGYGPYHTRLLAEHEDASDAVNNADNYRWYAQSKFWQWRCGRSFGPAPDNSYNDKLRVPN